METTTDVTGIRWESSDFDKKLRWRAVFRQGGNLAFADGHAKFLIAREADTICADFPALPQHSKSRCIHWSKRNVWIYPGMPEDSGDTRRSITMDCAK